MQRTWRAAQSWWRMSRKASLRAEPYHNLTGVRHGETRRATSCIMFSDRVDEGAHKHATGTARLSSARAVRRSVHSGNGQNPGLRRGKITGDRVGPSWRYRVRSARKQDDVKSSWSLCCGLSTFYNGAYKGKQSCERERVRKACRVRIGDWNSSP